MGTDAAITPGRIDVVERFAIALDREDYATALALVDADCVYTIGDDTFRGPEAIVGSYKGNGDAAARDFDEITYGSKVRAGADGWIVIEYSDHIRHAGRTLHHRCEQWVQVGARDGIVRIEHHDLPGERERLEAFRQSLG